MEEIEAFGLKRTLLIEALLHISIVEIFNTLVGIIEATHHHVAVLALTTVPTQASKIQEK